MNEYSKIITALGGRKVLVCVLVFLASLAALWFGKLPAEDYTTIALTTILAYSGANELGKIAQVVAKKGGAGGGTVSGQRAPEEES